MTAPVLVSTEQLRVSVNGGAVGVRIGIVGSDEFTIETCDPVVGVVTDAIVSWGGKSDLTKLMHGAFALEFQIPAEATAPKPFAIVPNLPFKPVAPILAFLI